ncbi:MAG: acetylxylan esterase [Bacteroidota bacterium]|nr:acetylxylan esterase [Bacteroidota bacterium]
MIKPVFQLLVVFVFMITKQTEAQNGSYLCVGDHWTEEQGAQFLDSLKLEVKDFSDWDSRAKQIREGIISGGGLPELSISRSVPESQFGDPIIQQGYQVQSFAIQVSDTGWIYGNLYKPLKNRGKKALVLCPHGHWSSPDDYGRFRADMQMRCATLARMGAWVFAYDMLGYGETDYASHQHPDALTIQTMTGVRILDYFLSLKLIDKDRVAITGASGGGTQSFILTAIDPRIKVSVPAVQVSAHFFGGCLCESGKPIHAWKGFQTNNVEIAALAAPRPMLLISDGDDWTKNTPEVEFPHIQWIYSLYGASDKVENAHFENEVHNYGPNKRQAMYKFMIKHLGLRPGDLQRKNGMIDESFVKILTRNELTR